MSIRLVPPVKTTGGQMCLKNAYLLESLCPSTYIFSKGEITFFGTSQRQTILIFPIRGGIRSFPLWACTQLCLMDSRERYSSSLWPDLFMTQFWAYTQATSSAQDDPDQCNSSLLSKTVSP